MRTPTLSLITIPTPDVPGFSLQAPSKFNFRKPKGGGIQTIFDLSTLLDTFYFILPLRGITKFGHCLIIMDSQSVKMKHVSIDL